MAYGFDYRQNRGTILVIALWSLSLLAVFALTLSTIVRQKIELLSRLENRSNVHLIAEGGIKKAVVILKRDLNINPRLSAARKMNRYNNQRDFKNIEFERGFCDVHYDYADMGMKYPQERFGFSDEESKININKADTLTLKRLIKSVFNWADDDAQRLANAIIDWREYGESEISGFYSDEYYENLEYPYKPKKTDFEVLDELLLVRGMNEEIFERLLPFVTIYGEGKVNVNSASRAVLTALGIKNELVDFILAIRRGPDGVEATEDDYIFENERDFPVNLMKMAGLKFPDIDELDVFVRQGKISVESEYYRIESKATLNTTKEEDVIRCVLNINDYKIEEWREQYKGRAEDNAQKLNRGR